MLTSLVNKVSKGFVRVSCHIYFPIFPFYSQHFLFQGIFFSDKVLQNFAVSYFNFVIPCGYSSNSFAAYHICTANRRSFIFHGAVNLFSEKLSQSPPNTFQKDIQRANNSDHYGNRN